MSPSNQPAVSPSRQAERILEAWASGNQPLLHQELQRGQGLRYASGQGLDQERIELLQAVSSGILRASGPTLPGSNDPSVRRCLDLLAHLAHAPGGESGLARGSFSVSNVNAGPSLSA